MVHPTLPLLGLSPVAGKELVARFDGGWLNQSWLADITRIPTDEG